MVLRLGKTQNLQKVLYKFLSFFWDFGHIWSILEIYRTFSKGSINLLYFFQSTQESQITFFVNSIRIQKKSRIKMKYSVRVSDISKQKFAKNRLIFICWSSELWSKEKMSKKNKPRRVIPRVGSYRIPTRVRPWIYQISMDSNKTNKIL